MEILFVDQFSEPGGAQLCLRDLVPGIQSRGWGARIMAPGDGAVFDKLGVAFHRLPIAAYANGRKSAADMLRFPLDIARAAASIRRAIRRHRVDLVYVNGPRVLPAAVGCGRPVLFHAHSVLDRGYARLLVQWSLRLTGAHVIAVSQFVADSMAGMVCRERVQVIYNGVAGQLRGPRVFDRRPTRVGIVGRIAPGKGQTDFVRAAARIAATRADVQFDVFGAALFSDAAFERDLRAMSESRCVQFHGWTADTAHALAELDVLVVPSTSPEACPRVVLEALSAGTPVVAYPSGGIPELIDERTGLLTNSSDVESLARSILFLIDHPDRRASLSSAARREWERRFQVERYRDQVCAAIESLLHDRARVPRRAPAIESSS